MARVIYSALIEKISGSIGGTTFQANAYGHTVKAKPNMVIPNTSFQREKQRYFSAAVKAWVSLSSAQRSSWNTWASTYPQYSKHNPSAVLSGYAVFTKIHFYRLMAGLSVLTSPVFTSYGSLSWAFTIYSYANHIDVVYDAGGNGDDYYNFFFLSRTFPQSQNFIGTSPRYMGNVNSDTGTLNCYTPYINTFGIQPVTGEYVSLRVVSIGKDNGQFPDPYAGIAYLSIVP